MLITETIAEGSKIIFRNGTETELDDTNVISASCKRQCCPDGRFEPGGVYAAALSMSCRLTGTNAFNIRGAKIILYSQYAGETNPFRIGTFWVTEATKNGEIFNITAHDAVSWLDTSSMSAPGQQIYSNFAKYLILQGYGFTLNDWGAAITELANLLVMRLTGESSAMFGWANYPENMGRIYTNHYRQNGQLAWFFLPEDTETDNCDSPRDLLRYIAELIDGFVYARPEDGKLTFGQFGEPVHGIQEIYVNETEFDTLEIADFRLYLYSAYEEASYIDPADGIKKTVAAHVALGSDFNYSVFAPYQVWIDSNPFLDGFTQYQLEDMTGQSQAVQLWNGLGMNQDGGSTGNDWYQFHVRPFHCRVHSVKRFHPGQKIRIHYQPPGASEIIRESILTSVTWTFRGGHYLACGGEDSRTMSECLHATRGLKAVEETRSRCAALRKKTSADPVPVPTPTPTPTPSPGFLSLDFVQAANQQYFNTGYFPNENTKIECEIMLLDDYDGLSQALFGCSGFSVKYSYYGAHYIAVEFGGQGTSTSSKTLPYYKKIRLVLDSQALTWYDENGTLIDSVSIPQGTFSTSGTPLWVGCLNNNGSVDSFGDFCLYSLRIYENNQPVMDFVPAKRISDNTPGVLDTLTNIFYPDLNSGGFVSSVFEDNYTAASYVDSDGNLYLNTGYTHTTDTKFVIDFIPNLSGISSFVPLWGTEANVGGNWTANDWWCYADSGALCIQRGRHEAPHVSADLTQRMQITAEGLTAQFAFADSSAQTVTVPSTIQSGLMTMWLFTTHYDGSPPSTKTIQRFYSCQIYENNTLVRDFIPVARISDSALMLYDRVLKIAFLPKNGSFSI